MTAKTLAPLKARIEQLVRERKIRAASAEIRSFLRRPGVRADFQSVIQACDWYRRLGLFREAYFLVSDGLADPLPTGKVFSTREPRGRKLLWAARLLNLLGASSHALLVARRLAGHDAESHQVLGNIFLANFDNEPALMHFERMCAFDQNPMTYRSSINRLGMADAFAGLKRYDKAIKIAEAIAEVKRDETERLLHGIALQAWGEYLARSEQFQKALPLLQRARAFFPPQDMTPDSAVLDKWEGYVCHKLGEHKRGLELLQSSVDKLRKLGVRPEAWLDVLRLINELQPIATTDAKRLAHYPGLPPGFTQQLNTTPTVFDDSRGDSPAEMFIDLDANEYSAQGRRFLGLSHELRLLGALRIVGDWGLGFERAKAIIWPEELYAYPLLEARLHKLIQRLRKHYRFDIELSGRSMFLSTESLKRVAIATGQPGKMPSFFADRTEFSARNLSGYYQLAKSQRAIWIRTWLDHGSIAAIGSGARQKYVILPAK